MPGKPEFQHRLETIEQLIGTIEGRADPALQGAVRELVELVMELHGAALERILELLAGGGASGLPWIETLGRDDLVSSLLVLHGLHPDSLEARVTRAVERIRPSLGKRGGDVELLSIQQGEVRFKLHANGHAAALKEVVENAVYQAAPDITSLLIDGGEERSGFVPLEALSGTAGGLNHVQTGSGKVGP